MTGQVFFMETSSAEQFSILAFIPFSLLLKAKVQRHWGPFYCMLYLFDHVENLSLNWGMCVSYMQYSDNFQISVICKWDKLKLAFHSSVQKVLCWLWVCEDSYFTWNPSQHTEVVENGFWMVIVFLVENLLQNQWQFHQVSKCWINILVLQKR